MVWVPRPHTFSFQRFEAWARGPWPSLCEGLSRRSLSRGRTNLMPIDQRRLLQVVAILGALFAYATIVVGGTVRGLEGGLAWPGWAVFNGSVVPNLANTQVLVEFVHRSVAALTGIFVLSTLVAALMWFRSEMRIVTLSIVSFAVLVTQVGVGALTITSGNDWVVVTIHLALGTATLGSALIVALVSLWPPKT